MRTARLKLPSAQSVAVYHCISKTVNGQRLFHPAAKEVLRRMIHQLADYCGVEILTFVVLDNHFHILVRVPLQTSLTDAELLRRHLVLYPAPTPHQPAGVEVIRGWLEVNGPEAEEWRQRHLARMGDVSGFMQALKERFSIWFNKAHNRFGPLWCGRFKSSLVEPRPRALMAVAAYIDLNPVRAGLVEDPKDYRFCGYAEAVAGEPRAREGLQSVLECPKWRQAQADYRQILFGRGADSMKPEELEAVIEQGGRLPLGTILRCRCRFLTDGIILGSRAFVQSQLAYFGDKIGGAREPSPLPDVMDLDDMAVMRRPRRPAFA